MCTAQNIFVKLKRALPPPAGMASTPRPGTPRQGAAEAEPARQRLRVCVEGNIGSGKTTSLERLALLRPDLALYPEPLEEWGALLGRFYREPSQWALAFSLRVLLSFARLGGHAGPCVVERSPMSCRHVFSQLLFNEGKLTQEEWDLFKDFCDALGWAPDVIVYVHAPADECYRRMQRRGRPEEAGVDLHYLKRLEFQYETMLRYTGVRVERVDGTQPPEVIAAAIAAIVDDMAA